MSQHTQNWQQVAALPTDTEPPEVFLIDTSVSWTNEMVDEFFSCLWCNVENSSLWSFEPDASTLRGTHESSACDHAPTQMDSFSSMPSCLGYDTTERTDLHFSSLQCLNHPTAELGIAGSMDAHFPLIPCVNHRMTEPGIAEPMGWDTPSLSCLNYVAARPGTVEPTDADLFSLSYRDLTTAVPEFAEPVDFRSRLLSCLNNMTAEPGMAEPMSEHFPSFSGLDHNTREPEGEAQTDVIQSSSSRPEHVSTERGIASPSASTERSVESSSTTSTPPSPHSLLSLPSNSPIDTGVQCFDHGCKGRRFSCRENYLRHLREKRGQNAARCLFCGSVFTRRSNRDKHVSRGKCHVVRRMKDAS
jgi:hypothetical protein